MENYEKYGRDAELVVMDFFNKNNCINLEHADANKKVYQGDFPQHMGMGRNTQSIKEMRVFRSRYGDIIIDYPTYPLKMNVVRGTWLSHDAVNRFKGHLYCLFPNGDISDPSQGRIVLASTLKNYKETCMRNKKNPEFISNKQGFRYKNIKAFMTLENFNTHLMKMIIMGIDIKFNGDFTISEMKEKSNKFWHTLKDPFIHDYKIKFQGAKR